MKDLAIIFFLLIGSFAHAQMTVQQRLSLSDNSIEFQGVEKGALADSSSFTVVSRSCGGDLGGPFFPGESVVFSIEYFHNVAGGGATWLHAFIPSIGNGWETPDFTNPEFAPITNSATAEWFDSEGDCGATMQNDVSEVCTYIDPNGVLQICNMLNEECPCSGGMEAGDPISSGFFWNTQGGASGCGTECTPSDNWGSGSSVSSVQWNLVLRVKDFASTEDCESSSNLQIGIQTFEDDITGCWVDPMSQSSIDPKELSPDWQLACRTLGLECSIYKAHYDVFIDYNQNGVQDDMEPNFYTSAIQVTENGSIYQDHPLGFQNIYLAGGEYNLMIDSASISGWESTTPSSVFITLNDSIPCDTILFGIYPMDIISDLDIEMAYSTKTCNEEAEITLALINDGYLPESGWVWFLPDSNFVDISFISPPDSVSGANTYGWQYDNLYPGTSLNFTFEATIPGPPLVEVGTLISNKLRIERIDSDDELVLALEKYSEFYVQCSYDPNDKFVEPNHPLNYTDVNRDRLTYMIRFQNTGNAPATNVVLIDTLSEFVVPSSIRLLKNSHNEVLSIRREGSSILIFEFRDIMLPDSTSNPIASQGYITFSVELRNNLPEGTTVDNTADIYFDLNPAITTNTVTNVLYFDSDGDGFFSFEDCDDDNPSINPEAEEVPNNDIDEDCDGEDLISSVENKILESIMLNPNPTPGVFHISNPTSTEITISVMDIHGRVILRSSRQNSDVNVDISHRENGLYFVSIRDDNGGSKVLRIIKL